MRANMRLDPRDYKSSAAVRRTVRLQAGEGRLGLGHQFFALVHLGLDDLGAPSAMHHPGPAAQLAVADAADVVHLAFQGDGVRHAVVQAVAGLAHGAVDQREQGAAVRRAVRVAQGGVHGQAQQRLALLDPDDFQAEQAPEAAALADAFLLQTHYFLNCLALANSAAMAALAGAGLSWLEWRSLRGWPPRLPRDCPRGPSTFSPGVSDMRMDRPTRWRGMSTSMTLTLTMSPALTTSLGSLTNFSDSADTCTRPSWCTPMSTKAP